ncbi:hypothetical protein BH744_12010 [Enterococcus villorum]|nr:hypothetical protein BH744_12010 [Enterococcus villorum]
MKEIKRQPEFWSKVLIAVYLYGKSLTKINHLFFRRFLLLSYIMIDTVLIRGLLNSQIPYRLTIGKGIRVWHPFGIIIHPNCVIGENVTIRHQVTIGKATDEGGVPILGNNITIGAGAKILGDIHIGDGTVIGANAVVTKSFPEKSILVGCPAIDISKTKN